MSLALVSSVVALGGPSAQAEPLPVPGLEDAFDYSVASDINASGHVVGSGQPSAGNATSFGFLLTDAGLTLLGPDESDVRTNAGSINDDGRIVGSIQDSPDGIEQATTWAPNDYGQAVGLNPDGWPGSQPVAMNSTGQVLLRRMEDSDDIAPPSEAAVWTPGGGTEILSPVAGANAVFPRDLNDDGQVVGLLADGYDRVIGGFIWDSAAGMREIAAPAGARFHPAEINDAGAVAGVLHTSGQARTAVWTPSGFTEAPVSGTQWQQTRGMNDAGAVVIQSDLGSFSWTPGSAPVRIPSLGGGQVQPSSINDSGTVVGSSRLANQAEHPFSWHPSTGTVDLGVLDGSRGAAQVVEQTGVSVGWRRTAEGEFHASVWPSTVNSPRRPGPPTGVVALAGDARALVSWSGPTDNGGLWVDYEVAAVPAGGGEPIVQPVEAIREGAHQVTLTGLSNDVAYVVSVVAQNSEGSSNPASAGAVTPRAGKSLPTTIASTEVSAGSSGALSTGWQTSVEEPVATSVYVPQGAEGGLLAIGEGPVDLVAPSSYNFLGQQVDITAPARSAEEPLELRFTLDQSLLANVTDPMSVDVFRTPHGETTPELVPACADEDASMADPDPCVSDRYWNPDEEDGEPLSITILTSRASAWNFGVADDSGSFDFSGFFAPVDLPPTVNVVKAGRAVPIKFSLGGDHGLDVLADGFPRSVKHGCDNGAPADSVETTLSAGSDGLTYDSASDTYTYAWKVPKAYAGHCRTFVLELSDGSEHIAEFAFR